MSSSSILNGAKKEEQRGVVRFLMAGGAGTCEIHRRMSKRPGMLSDAIILLHDNAHPYTTNLVRDKLQRFGWKTLQHPPYSPDLSPCDFHIFWRPEETHSLDVGFIGTIKCKSGAYVHQH